MHSLCKHGKLSVGSSSAQVSLKFRCVSFSKVFSSRYLNCCPDMLIELCLIGSLSDSIAHTFIAYYCGQEPGIF